jgi:hypothetical protein
MDVRRLRMCVMRFEMDEVKFKTQDVMLTCESETPRYSRV